MFQSPDRMVIEDNLKSSIYLGVRRINGNQQKIVYSWGKEWEEEIIVCLLVGFGFYFLTN